MNTKLDLLGPAPEPSAPLLLLSIDLSSGTVTVHGELDRQEVHRLTDAVAALLHSPSPRWSIDLADVTFCDVAGLRGLLAARRLAARSGRRLSVTRPSPWLRRLMHLTGVDAPDADTAVGTSPVVPSQPLPRSGLLEGHHG